MDWTNQTVLHFLELYQMHPCIWDPKHPSHNNKNRVNDAWIDIKNNLEPCTVKELKKKRESLMSAYRGYRAKIKKSESSGAGASDLYQPTWFAYSFMDSFLGTIYKCTPSTDTEDVADRADQNQQNVADSNNAQHDTGCTDTVGETDALNQEENSSHATIQHNSMNQGSSASQQTSTTSRRRQYNPPELQQTKKQMDQAFNILQAVSQQHLNEKEDECCIFGKLIETKMRKLSEDSRNLMMIKINELFYNECHERHHRPNSSTSPVSYTPSPSLRIEQDDIPQVMTSPAADSYADAKMPVYSLQVASPTQQYTANNMYEGPASEMNKFLIFKKK